MTPEEELRFLAQTLADAKRTIICEPHREAEFRAAVYQMGRSLVWTVRGSRACPAGKILVLDENAMQATYNQTVQRTAHSIMRRYP